MSERMESIEEDEVIVKTSELGKLWSSPEIAAAVPYEIFPDDHATPFLDFDYSGTTLRDSSFPVPHSPGSSTCGTDESDDNQWIFIDSEAIRNRFTRENRLACNSNYLSEKLAELSVVLEDIKNEAADLFQVKEDAEKKSAKVKCLIELKAEFKSQLTVINNLISYEELMLEQLTTVDEQSDSNHFVLSEISNHHSQEPSLPDTIQDSSTVSEDPSTFETGSTVIESSEDVLGQDEIYEANESMSDIFACNLNDTIIDAEENEFASTQRIVLDELKTTLRPRRADMVNREREAYIRNYGTAPPEVDESEQFVRVRTKSKKSWRYNSPPRNAEQTDDVDKMCEKIEEFRPFFMDNPNSPYFNAPSSEQETEDQEINANVYEDSVVEEPSIDMFSAAISSQRPNFFAFLENTLEGPSSRIAGGIVPIYKREDSTSETNESETD